MNIKEIRLLPAAELAALLGRIPFFKELRLRDDQQLQLLLTYSCLVELAPGETIMRRGQVGTWLYFLVKGQLQVYRDEPELGSELNTITPGELFGDLALLCDHERKATVAAPVDRSALLFACDFKAFGALDNFSQVQLSTKLLFYRTVVHSIRWRLEVNRMQQPQHPLVAELLKVPVYAGAREGIEELRAWHRQAQSLATILERWNSDLGNAGELFVAHADSSAAARGDALN
ncbi:MAG TPA: cyclic nucleotide-binding domain-containing protein [Spongiibacteraceae bacterium]|nr:cyclic nucleotide-binding domain-containing protein [Spongiibacteraceae bacterium]